MPARTRRRAHKRRSARKNERQKGGARHPLARSVLERGRRRVDLQPHRAYNAGPKPSCVAHGASAKPGGQGQVRGPRSPWAQHQNANKHAGEERYACSASGVRAPWQRFEATEQRFRPSLPRRPQQPHTHPPGRRKGACPVRSKVTSAEETVANKRRAAASPATAAPHREQAQPQLGSPPCRQASRRQNACAAGWLPPRSGVPFVEPDTVPGNAASGPPTVALRAWRRAQPPQSPQRRALRPI